MCGENLPEGKYAKVSNLENTMVAFDRNFHYCLWSGAQPSPESKWNMG